jgi:hypothetical protein
MATVDYLDMALAVGGLFRPCEMRRRTCAAEDPGRHLDRELGGR